MFKSDRDNGDGSARLGRLDHLTSSPEFISSCPSRSWHSGEIYAREWWCPALSGNHCASCVHGTWRRNTEGSRSFRSVCSCRLSARIVSPIKACHVLQEWAHPARRGLSSLGTSSSLYSQDCWSAHSKRRRGNCQPPVQLLAWQLCMRSRGSARVVHIHQLACLLARFPLIDRTQSHPSCWSRDLPSWRAWLHWWRQCERITW